MQGFLARGPSVKWSCQNELTRLARLCFNFMHVDHSTRCAGWSDTPERPCDGWELHGNEPPCDQCSGLVLCKGWKTRNWTLNCLSLARETHLQCGTHPNSKAESKLKPKYSFGKWWKWKISLMGIVHKSCTSSQSPVNLFVRSHQFS